MSVRTGFDINRLSLLGSICAGGCIIACFLLSVMPAMGVSATQAPATKPTLQIKRNPLNGKAIITWTGSGALREISATHGLAKTVLKSSPPYEFTPTGNFGMFQLQTTTANFTVYSVNVVGYVNVYLPPGLSLISNPLYYTNNTLAFWWPEVPDGSQVFKYVAGNGYEVSTFDGLSKSWSNPNLEVTIGTGYYFRNPTTNTFRQTFVGEVLQGELINPLPAGCSSKASMVPIKGSINSVHLIPGEPGDELRLYVNESLLGGHYVSSIFSGELNAWTPDLTLDVAQGFWIKKQNPQAWVRNFIVF